MQIAISISDTSIDSVGPPYATFVYVVVVVFFLFSIVMDVLDDYNRSDYYTPTIAQEIYLSPCFHYFIHTLYIAKPTHMELLVGREGL